MPQSCTCGTQLIENARFCHQCGRPTFDAEPVETPPPLPRQQPSLQEKLAQLPVNFGNPIALRVAFLMSLGITLVEEIPFLDVLFLAWWLGAGWCAVLLYRRITGLSLSVPAGARLGSITGVLTFVSMAIVASLKMVVEGRQLLDQMAKQDPRLSQVVNDPAMLGAVFLLGLGVVFALVVAVCASGGALCARLLARKAQASPK